MILELALDFVTKKKKKDKNTIFNTKKTGIKTWCCAFINFFSIINTKKCLAMFR